VSTTTAHSCTTLTLALLLLYRYELALLWWRYTQVHYKRTMPDIDSLMEVWPEEFEHMLGTAQVRTLCMQPLLILHGFTINTYFEVCIEFEHMLGTAQVRTLCM
jgi:Intraflagellar transport complex B protein 46 C terminal